MQQFLVAFILAFLVVSCSHAPTSSANAKELLEEKYRPLVGKATKNDFIENFGEAEWCRPAGDGEETCRYYKKVQTKWVGEEKTSKKDYLAYDEVVADFSRDGTLKDFKAKAQR